MRTCAICSHEEAAHLEDYARPCTSQACRCDAFVAIDEEAEREAARELEEVRSDVGPEAEEEEEPPTKRRSLLRRSSRRGRSAR